MKNYAKVGSRRGRPAYRTSARFRQRQQIKIRTNKIGLSRFMSSPT